MLISGDPRFIPPLETAVYPPSEGLNDGFEAFVGPTGSATFIGKKTDRLRDFLRLTDDSEWEDLLWVELRAEPGSDTFLLEIGGFRPALTSAERVAMVDEILASWP